MTTARNAPCPCGSGLRYKACHGAVTPADFAQGGMARESAIPRQLMDEALREQQSGHWVPAERLYRRVLEQMPDEPDCLHMLGVICYQTGRYREAATLILRALRVIGGRAPVMRHNLRLVAEHLGDEPLFWSPNELALFALPPAPRVAVCTPASPPRSGGRVLVVDWAMPKPDRDSGSVRMLAILRLWREMGCAVTFTSMAMENDPDRAGALAETGITVVSGPDNWAGPVQVLADVGTEFDVILVSRLEVAQSYQAAIRRFAPQALFVFDTVDLHFLRLQREARVSGDPRIAARAAIVRQQELGVVRAADLTLVVSDVEQALLREEAPEARIEVLSNVHEATERRHGFDQRHDVFFVGGFRHAPNVDAVHWYATEVWPRVHRQLPELRTFILGSEMPASVAALASNGLVTVGYAPDLRPWLDGCRVAIAPLRFGAGVKGKVSLALSAGVPVVATSIAAEGMHLVHGRDVLLGDSAEAFADAVVRLHEDPTTWTRMSDAGLLAAGRHFSPDRARPVLERACDLALSLRPARAAVRADQRGAPRSPAVTRRALILPPASFGSLGDEAMVRGVASCIQALDEGWEIDLLSIYGGEKWPLLPGIRNVIDLHPGEPSCLPELVGKFRELARHYSAFAVLGADVLDGHYSIGESMQRLEVARAASGQGCATAILGFSINDHTPAEVLAALAAVAARGRLFARDPVSWRRLQYRGIRNLALVADLAFLMRPASRSGATAEIEAWIGSEHASGRRVVMLNLSATLLTGPRPGADDRAGALVTLACDLVSQRNASILWCPHDLRPTVAPGDSDCELAAEFSRRVARRLGGSFHQRIASPMGADEIKRVAGLVDMIVSARMHLAIAALGMGKPVVGIAYQGKFEGLWECFGLRGTLFDAGSLGCSGFHEACIESLDHLDDLARR